MIFRRLAAALAAAGLLLTLAPAAQAVVAPVSAPAVHAAAPSAVQVCNSFRSKRTLDVYNRETRRWLPIAPDSCRVHVLGALSHISVDYGEYARSGGSCVVGARLRELPLWGATEWNVQSGFRCPV